MPSPAVAPTGAHLGSHPVAHAKHAWTDAGAYARADSRSHDDADATAARLHLSAHECANSRPNISSHLVPNWRAHTKSDATATRTDVGAHTITNVVPHGAAHNWTDDVTNTISLVRTYCARLARANSTACSSYVATLARSNVLTNTIPYVGANATTIDWTDRSTYPQPHAGAHGRPDGVSSRRTYNEPYAIPHCAANAFPHVWIHNEINV
jgi:hypothetical protein